MAALLRCLFLCQYGANIVSRPLGTQGVICISVHDALAETNCLINKPYGGKKKVAEVLSGSRGLKQPSTTHVLLYCLTFLRL